MYISSKEILGKQVHASCSDDNLAIIENLSDIEDIPFAVKLESYAVALLTKGHASFFIDSESYEMSANHLFVFRPQITLDRTMVSADAEYSIVILTQQYAQSLIAVDGRNTWDILFFLSNNPTISLEPEQVEVFQRYFLLLRHHLMNPTLPHHHEIVDHLFSAALYEFHNAIEQQLNNTTSYSFSHSEALFRKFYDLLSITTPKRQKVEYYAQKLNITPKYFSSICKQITGKSAIQHITDAVLHDITILLRDESMSIKQIAQVTGFPNQSFLGSYMRKHLGMSPYKYRKQLLSKSEPSNRRQ